MGKRAGRRAIRVAVIFLLALAWSGCSDGDSPSGFVRTIRQTTAFINQEMARNNLVGLSIALVSDGRLVWAQGFGWADKENRVKATAETLYMLGSGSKTLTTAALMQLVDQGLVSLDKPAADYLPEFALAPRFPGQMAGITVARLLNHHSGIPGDIYNGGFVEEAWNHWGCGLYMDWLLGYLAGEYPSYAPGELAVYCNTGFVLAGEIVRRQGGLPGEGYNDCMIRRLFKPLKMYSTSFRATPGMAKGYIGGQPAGAIESNCTFGATGGAVTTVLDISRFLSMMTNEGKAPWSEARTLSPESVNRMGQSEKTPLDFNSYSTPGLGLDTMDDPVLRYAGRAWTKNGSTGHFNSFMEMLPDANLGVIVLANSDTAQFAVYAVARECLKNAVREKLGLPPSLPAYPDLPCETDPALIAGTYVKKNGFDRMDNNGDGTLTWVRNAHSLTPLMETLAYGQGSWGAAGASMRLVFQNVSYMGADRFLMIQKGSDGSVVNESILGGYVVLALGEKLPIPAISPAWLARVGQTWLIDNISWNGLDWDLPFLLLDQAGGELMVHQGENHQVLFPENDALAFVGGIANRNGSSVRAINDGAGEKLWFVGYEAFPIDQVPRVFTGDVVNGQVDFHKVDWYRFDAPAPGAGLVFSVANGAGGYRLRLFDANLVSPLVDGTDRIAWQAPQGTYYLAVCRKPDGPGNYTLQVNP
ncbi:MAG: serine hydrolase domain-containing protein [Thermodesulfobacteriota bacterium]